MSTMWCNTQQPFRNYQVKQAEIALLTGKSVAWVSMACRIRQILGEFVWTQVVMKELPFTRAHKLATLIIKGQPFTAKQRMDFLYNYTRRKKGRGPISLYNRYLKQRDKLTLAGRVQMLEKYLYLTTRM